MVLESFRLNGRNAVVTGGGGGLGSAMALALAEAGANVAVHGRNREALERVCCAVRSVGVKACAVEGDLSIESAAAELIETTARELGPVDILVNNAGIIRRDPAAEVSDQDWQDVIGLNVTSVFRLCRAAGRQMLERGCGKIVNIASLLSFQGGILVPAYAASKGAVAQLTKALANEWAPRGVHVNAIAPGYMETPNTEALRADPDRNRQILERIPCGRWGKPRDLSGAVVFLASPASDYLHGHVLAVDGGWLAR
jgi:2-deoxy-D-gluconate 3-dehydrogenase